MTDETTKMASDTIEPTLSEVEYHYFSEKGSTKFPSIFQDILKFCPHAFLKDILVMTLITAFSALLAKVRFNYKQNRYSANIFWMLAGKSGGYKSYALLSRHMLKDVFAKYDIINQQRERDYMRAQDRWDNEKKVAGKEKRESDYSLLPLKSLGYIMFYCSDTISKSQLMHNFNNSQDTGMIVYNSELGAIIASLGQDCGKYLADLRKAAMNEPIAQHYKSDGKAIKIPFPMLSFILTATFLEK